MEEALDLSSDRLLNNNNTYATEKGQHANCNFDVQESVQRILIEYGGTTVIEIEMGVIFSDNTGCKVE